MAGDINKFCDLMRYWCDEGNLGYDQSNRWDIRHGGECDCSSLVIHCLKDAGFDTGDASYTGNMSSNLTARGWKRITNSGHPQKGDILLNDINHVAVWLGDCLAQASIDERGKISGGQAGDQTGRETWTRSYYNYPWNCYLRYGGASGGDTQEGKLTVDGYWGQDTTKRTQEVLGTFVDGFVDGQDRGSMTLVNGGGLSYASWKIGTGGSPMIRALQKLIGADADGYFGVKTCRKLQEFLGTYVDGYVSPASPMVKAWQRWLNSK